MVGFNHSLKFCHLSIAQDRKGKEVRVFENDRYKLEGYELGPNEQRKQCRKEYAVVKKEL